MVNSVSCNVQDKKLTGFFEESDNSYPKQLQCLMHTFKCNSNFHSTNTCEIQILLYAVNGHPINVIIKLKTHGCSYS